MAEQVIGEEVSLEEMGGDKMHGSVAGGGYILSFCDIVVMVEGNACMYLGSPRMAEKVIGEKVSLEEMGGAKMHCSVSGCGDVLVKSEEEAISFAQKYLSYFPASFR